MAEFFVMPQASPTMEKGTLLAWKKAEGAVLGPQDVIAEVETDKAAMEIEVFDAGVLLKLLAAEGDEIPAGQPIAIIGKSAGEDITALVAAFAAMPKGGGAAASASAPASASASSAASAPASSAAPASASSAASASAAAPASTAASTVVGLQPFLWQGLSVDAAIMEQPLWSGEADSGSSPANGKVRASPAARRAAREAGVELSAVNGTGPRGRVTSQDVEAQAHAPSAPSRAPVAQDQVVRNSQMRKTIARRLKAAYLDAPTFFLTINLNVERLVGFRAQLKAAGSNVSYNDVVVAAVARALREVPEVNASWGEDSITRHGQVHVGIAVAIEDGLITPVVRDADQRRLSDIATTTRDLAERARNRKLGPDEYTGSTFTISNLGMMGIEHFTAIINPPEACILAVGGLQQEPVVVDGALAVGWRMRVTLTCDHRVVDGALGAKFLGVVRRYVETPELLA